MIDIEDNRLNRILRILLIAFGIVLLLFASYFIAIKVKSSKYSKYDNSTLYNWLDETWQDKRASNVMRFSYGFREKYDDEIILDSIDQYCRDRQLNNLRYCYEVKSISSEAYKGDACYVVKVYFEYNDVDDYLSLKKYDSISEALIPLLDVLNKGKDELFFMVRSSWTDDDINLLANELSLNDVHRSTEWSGWNHWMTTVEDSGYKIAYIKRVIPSNSQCSQEECDTTLDNTLENIAANIRSKGYISSDEMYMAAANAIIESASYSEDIRINSLNESLSEIDRIKRSAYGAVVLNETVCAGYAYAYKALCDKLDLDCWVVSGYLVDEAHAWNVIRDGRSIDCCMCDVNNNEDFLFMDSGELLTYEYSVPPNYTLPYGWTQLN